MRYLLIIFTVIRVVNCEAQVNDSLKFNSDSFRINFADQIMYASKSVSPPSPYTIENAVTDIESDSLKIVIRGGFTGFGDIDKYRSTVFEQKYNVKLRYVGCLVYYDTKNEDIDGYNSKIFEHLVNKYGEIVKMDYENIWNK